MPQELYPTWQRARIRISQMRKFGLREDLNLDLPHTRTVQLGGHGALEMGLVQTEMCGRCKYIPYFKDFVQDKKHCKRFH